MLTAAPDEQVLVAACAAAAVITDWLIEWLRAACCALCDKRCVLIRVPSADQVGLRLLAGLNSEGEGSSSCEWEPVGLHVAYSMSCFEDGKISSCLHTSGSCVRFQSQSNHNPYSVAWLLALQSPQGCIARVLSCPGMV
jgi:hypothetical protein